MVCKGRVTACRVRMKVMVCGGRVTVCRGRGYEVVKGIECVCSSCVLQCLTFYRPLATLVAFVNKYT